MLGTKKSTEDRESRWGWRVTTGCHPSILRTTPTWKQRAVKFFKTALQKVKTKDSQRRTAARKRALLTGQRITARAEV